MKLDKHAFDKFRRDVEEALKSVALNHGVKITAGAISYEDAVNFKMQLIVKDGNSERAKEKERKMFDLYGPGYGLTVADFGRTFMYKNRSFTVTGLKPGNRCPVVTANGTCFSVPLYKSCIAK